MIRLPILLFVTAASLSRPAFAQELSPDRRAIADAADQAAAQAERAEAEAERALNAAKLAAAAAREAANRARALAEGRAFIPSQTAAIAPAGPPDENMAVTTDNERQRAFAGGIAASVANGQNSGTLKTSPVPDFQLVASSKDKVGTVSWSMDISGQPQPGSLSVRQLTLTGSAKLDDNGNGSILGLDGLSNGAEIKLAYTEYISEVNLSGREPDPVAQARTLCGAQPGATKESCNPYKFPTGVGGFVAKYNPAGLEPLLAQVMPGNIFFYGFGASGNPANFKYLDRTAFALKKVSHFGYGANLFAGVLIGSGHTALIGSFDFKRSYEPADDVTLCQPVSGTVQSQCLTGADGAPTRKKQALVGVELRHAFRAAIGSYASLAVAPKFTADVSSGEFSFTTPIYFVSDGGGKLRGGVQGTFTSRKDKDGKRKDDYAVGLFVGVPFTLFHE